MNPFETLSSEAAKLVLLYLREQGDATADELRSSLDIPLLKLLPVLRTLERQSLVAQRGDRYVPAEEVAGQLPA